MKSEAKPYINPYVGGTLLGVVLFLAFLLTGNGLGASGAINRVQLAVVDAIAPHHVDKVAYFAETAGGHRNPLSNPSVLMLLGTLLGGMLSGFIFKRFKVELRKGPHISNALRLAMALSGGVIMGYGARLARGCTSGQALSGGAVLSVGSWAFMLAVFAGGYLLAYFVRRLWT
ncbi:MAG: YeeE/YedE family protein [Myxococcales bacterium]|nr:MAG: YeeE/YedE family protein [Myxococcales bacterium]